MRLFLLDRRTDRQETQDPVYCQTWLDNALGHALVAGPSTGLSRRSATLGKLLSVMMTTARVSASFAGDRAAINPRKPA